MMIILTIWGGILHGEMDRLPERRMLIIDNWNYSEDVLGKLTESRFTTEKVHNLERIFNAPVTVFAQGGPNYTIAKQDVLTKISSFLDSFDEREESIAYIYIHAHGGKYGPSGEEQACLYSEAARLEKDGSFTVSETILEEEIAGAVQSAKNDNARLKVFLFVDACSQAKNETKQTMSDRQFRWADVSRQQAKKQKMTYRDVADMTMFAGLGSVREEDNIYAQLIERYNSSHLKQRLSVDHFKKAARSDFVYYGSHIADAVIRETQALVQFDEFTPGAVVEQSSLPVFLHQPNVIPAASYSFTIREDRGDYFEDYYLKRSLQPGLNYLFTPDSCQQLKGSLLLKFPGNTAFEQGAMLNFTVNGDKYSAAWSAEMGGFVSQLLPGQYGMLNYKEQVVARQFTISSNTTTSFTLQEPVKARDIYIPTAVELNFLKKHQFDYITRLFFPNQVIIDSDGFLYNERQVQYFTENAYGNFFTTLKYAKGRLYGLEDRWINISGDDSVTVVTFPETIRNFIVLENGGGYALSAQNQLYEFTHDGQISTSELALEGRAREIFLVDNQVVIIVRDDYNRYFAYRYAYQEGLLEKFQLEGVVSDVYQLNTPYLALHYRDRIRIVDVSQWQELPLVPALSQDPYFVYHRDHSLYMDFDGQLFQVTVTEGQPAQKRMITKFPKGIDPNNTVVFGRALLTLKTSRKGSYVEVISDEGRAEYDLNDAVNRMYLYGQQVYFTSEQVLLTYALVERDLNNEN